MSTASGLVRASRALLAAAKSAAASAPKAPAAPAAAARSKKAAAPAAPKPPKKKKAPSGPTGIMMVKPISLTLQDFVGVPEISRVEAVRKIWAHIKLNNLQNPANKKEIFCDDKLKKLFAGKDKVGFLEVGKLLSSHFVKSA